MPFYFIGYLYGQLRDKIQSSKSGVVVTEVMVAICFVCWLYILVRISVYDLGDNISEIALRAVTSLTGVIAVCGFCEKTCGNDSNSTILGRAIRQIGVDSLSFYVTHGLFLNIFQMNHFPTASSVQGALLWGTNFAITLTLTALSIFLINKNRVLSFVLYGRRK